MKGAPGLLVVAIVLCPALLHAHSKKLTAIDEYCSQIRDEFRDNCSVSPSPALIRGLKSMTSAQIYPTMRWHMCTPKAPPFAGSCS